MNSAQPQPMSKKSTHSCMHLNPLLTFHTRCTANSRRAEKENQNGAFIQAHILAASIRELRTETALHSGYQKQRLLPLLSPVIPTSSVGGSSRHLSSAAQDAKAVSGVFQNSHSQMIRVSSLKLQQHTAFQQTIPGEQCRTLP